jgi:hypothetical protein
MIPVCIGVVRFQEHILKSRVISGANPEIKGRFRSQSRNQGSFQEPIPKPRVISGAIPETKGHFRSHSRNQEPVQEPVPKPNQHLEIMEA